MVLLCRCGCGRHACCLCGEAGDLHVHQGVTFSHWLRCGIGSLSALVLLCSMVKTPHPVHKVKDRQVAQQGGLLGWTREMLEEWFLCAVTQLN